MERIDTFDFPYAMNSYQILVNLSTSNSRLDCPSGTVAFIAYCGKYYTFYFIFNCLNNVISIILQIVIVQRLQKKITIVSIAIFSFLYQLQCHAVLVPITLRRNVNCVLQDLIKTHQARLIAQHAPQGQLQKELDQQQKPIVVVSLLSYCLFVGNKEHILNYLAIKYLSFERTR